MPLRFSKAISLIALLASLSVHAAEITRVASSFEPKKMFGLFLDTTFERTQTKGSIVREGYDEVNGVPGLYDLKELRYQLTDTRLKFDAHVGIYQDLELHFALPIVFQQDREWAYAKGTDASNTSLYRSNIDAQGGFVTPAPRLIDMDSGDVRSYRGGLGDLTFGLAWAIVNQKKDDTKPTWVFAFDYIAPTASLNDPSKLTSNTARGGIGDKIHRYKFTTSISKRLGPADPYFSLHYTLPYRAGGFYSNCDNPDPSRMGRPQNCGQATWDRARTGTQPPHVGGFVFGSEFNAFENVDRHQKVALDLRGWLTYVSEGRYTNELSDVLGKQLYSGDYAQVGGSLGFTGHAAEFIHLKGSASIAYNTEHYLTAENIGDDSDDPGEDVQINSVEANPNYDYRVDHVGRRFRITEMFTFQLMVTASFNF